MRLQLKKHITLVILSSLFSCSVLASDPKAVAPGVTVCSFPIERFVLNETEGEFVKMLKFISNEIKIKFSFSVLPAGRCREMFLSKQIDIYFPSNNKAFENNVAQVISSPFYTRRNFIFYKGDKVLDSLKQLEGLKVSLTRGYVYRDELVKNPKIDIQYTSNDTSNMEMLVRDRVDATVMEELSALRTIKDIKAKGIKYNNEKPTLVQESFFSIQPERKELVGKINSAIEKYKSRNF